jgi:hypothetical protein
MRKCFSSVTRFNNAVNGDSTYRIFEVPSRFVLPVVFSPWLDAHYAQKERGPRKSVPKKDAPQKSTRQTFAFVYPHFTFV